MLTPPCGLLRSSEHLEHDRMFHQLLNVVVTLAIITDSLAIPTCACGAGESNGASSATAPATPGSCCGDHGQVCCRRAKSSSGGMSVLSTAARERKSCCRAPATRSQETHSAPILAQDATNCDCHATSPAYLAAAEVKSKQVWIDIEFASFDAPIVPLACHDPWIVTAVGRHRPSALQRCVELQRFLI